VYYACDFDQDLQYCWIWGSHNGDTEDYYLLGSDARCSDRISLIIRFSDCYLNFANRLLWLFFVSDDDIKFFRNVCELLLQYNQLNSRIGYMLYNEGSLHNNIREKRKWTLLYQHLFYFSVHATCFGPLYWAIIRRTMILVSAFELHVISIWIHIVFMWVLNA
jgi:hypothetical protein